MYRLASFFSVWQLESRKATSNTKAKLKQVCGAFDRLRHPLTFEWFKVPELVEGPTFFIILVVIIIQLIKQIHLYTVPLGLHNLQRHIGGVYINLLRNLFLGRLIDFICTIRSFL